MQPPNPRVQRTSLRLPLTRKALGLSSGIRCVLLASILLLSSCGKRTALKPVKVPELIRVEQNYPQKLLAELKDPGQIRKVITFINARPNIWTVPLAGPPVGKVYLLFLTGGKQRGNFYVGPRFFGRDQDLFWSQSATEEEIAQLGQLIGLPLVEIVNAR